MHWTKPSLGWDGPLPRVRDAKDAQRPGMFHLGKAGGLAFSLRLPGIESDALFDDISDAAEKRDLDQIGRIRRSVGAKPGSDHSTDEPPPARRGLDWDAGPLQMLAVLNEARTAREEGDPSRYSLMAGFLVGLMGGMAGRGVRYQHGTLVDAVFAAHDRNPERAAAWVQAESITGARSDRENRRARIRNHSYCDGWGARLAAAHRMSSPTFFRFMNETEDQRRDREAGERAYYEREETSIQRAQNFGKRRGRAR